MQARAHPSYPSAAVPAKVLVVDPTATGTVPTSQVIAGVMYMIKQAVNHLARNRRTIDLILRDSDAATATVIASCRQQLETIQVTPTDAPALMRATRVLTMLQGTTSRGAPPRTDWCAELEAKAFTTLMDVPTGSTPSPLPSPDSLRCDETLDDQPVTAPRRKRHRQASS
jgi:alcohol dehydrogenase YqhD (iron-dependent ADH family)